MERTAAARLWTACISMYPFCFECVRSLLFGARRCMMTAACFRHKLQRLHRTTEWSNVISGPSLSNRDDVNGSGEWRWPHQGYSGNGSGTINLNIPCLVALLKNARLRQLGAFNGGAVDAGDENREIFGAGKEQRSLRLTSQIGQRGACDSSSATALPSGPCFQR